MNHNLRAKQGFTLIELLTVIAIIGILAGLLLPALSAAREKAKIARAQTEVKGIATAWKTYFNEYGKWPCDANNCPIGSSVSAAENGTGIPFNHWFVSMMQGSANNDPPYLAARDNPKGIPFLQIPTKAIINGDYVDPWGNAYLMLFDKDYDNVVKTAGGVTNNVIVWSLGPDKVDHTKDDVTSWE